MAFAAEKVVLEQELELELEQELLERGPLRLTTPISTRNDETPAQYRTINR